MIVRAACLAVTWRVTNSIAPAAFIDAPLVSLAAVLLLAAVIGWTIWPIVARFAPDSSAD